MKVLIFGGTGAIGIPVVQLLTERGHEVYVTSRKKRKSKFWIYFSIGFDF